MEPETEKTAIKCPVCEETMAHVSFRGVEIDICYTCRGIWLNRGELEQLLEKAPKTGALLKSRKRYSRSVEKRRPCPECGVDMIKSTIGLNSPLVFDHCPEGHGEWFDRGELLSLLQQGGMDLSNLIVRLLKRILAQDTEGE